MKMVAELEFRGVDVKTFKAKDGKDMEMAIVTFLDENDSKILMTIAPDSKDFKFSELKRGTRYNVSFSDHQAQLVSQNDLATMYQMKFKFMGTIPFSVKPEVRV